MSVCQKCGYVESFDWKNSPHQLYMKYLNPDEAVGFFASHQTLAKALATNPKYAEEDYYAYRITKSGHLHRQPKTHCVNGKWTNYSSCYENAKRAAARRGQRKLLEIEK